MRKLNFWIVLVGAGVSVAGCDLTTTVPLLDPPDAAGIIVEAPTTRPGYAFLLESRRQGSTTPGERYYVAIPEGTRIYRRFRIAGTENAEARWVRVGVEAEVWFDGKASGSNPRVANANTILILEKGEP